MKEKLKELEDLKRKTTNVPGCIESELFWGFGRILHKMIQKHVYIQFNSILFI